MTHVEKVMAEFGFQIWQTGGGCLAYRKDNDDGSYFMVTTDDGCFIPEEPTEMILVGFYQNADDEGSCDEVSFDEFERLFMA